MPIPARICLHDEQLPYTLRCLPQASRPAAPVEEGGARSDSDTRVRAVRIDGGGHVSAAVYLASARNGVWGMCRSDDGRATWTRFNGDAHPFGGIGVMADDHNVYGRIYVSGNRPGAAVQPLNLLAPPRDTEHEYVTRPAS
jgi:hypothetical protein